MENEGKLILDSEAPDYGGIYMLFIQNNANSSLGTLRYKITLISDALELKYLVLKWRMLFYLHVVCDLSFGTHM